MMWRRKTSVVNFKQQVWFGLEVVLITMAFLALCGYLFFVPPVNGWFGPETDPRIMEQIWSFIGMKWPVLVLAFTVLFVIGMLMSHRLAGPLFGLDKTIAAWRRGDRTARVRFRKYDYLISIKEPLNDMFSEEEERLKQVELAAKELAQHNSPDVRKLADGILQALKPKNEA